MKNKKDKRVLKSRYNRPPANVKRKKSNKNGGTAILIVIIALVAFVIGAGIGVSMSFDDGGSDEKDFAENVTVEMTTNLSDAENQFIYDEDMDGVDYNNQEDLNELNVSNQSFNY